jgi:hypothetical protein
MVAGDAVFPAAATKTQKAMSELFQTEFEFGKTPKNKTTKSATFKKGILIVNDNEFLDHVKGLGDKTIEIVKSEEGDVCDILTIKIYSKHKKQ